MKTSLKKITLTAPDIEGFVQRIITQDIHQCLTAPKLSTLCTHTGKVLFVFWVQYRAPQLFIWIEQTQLEPLINTIKHYDPFSALSITPSDQTYWTKDLSSFSTTPIIPEKPWALFLIQQCIVNIDQQSRGSYTPHILQLEKQAVCFKKGCFIGHEVIARTEFLGRTKRLISYATSESQPESSLNCIKHEQKYHYLSITRVQHPQS
jgi:folate-binding protein YgfZ